MKKFWLACTMVIAVGISGCVDSDKDLYQEAPEKETNLSDFSTKQVVQVEADYSNADSHVPFYIYDKNPIKPQEAESNTITIDENIEPLDGAWTDEQGKYSGKMSLPAYVSEVYIVSTSPFATKPVIEGKVENGILKFSETDEQIGTRASEPQGKKNTQYNANRFKSLGWNNALGSFDTETGKINYLYNGDLKLSKSEMKELKTTINSVLKNSTSFVCPQAYRTGADLYIEKNQTAVALTALSGWTCWNSSLGYYYYRADKVPTNLNDVTIYTIFPNTQTSWNNGYGVYSYPRGINEGESVQLKYFDKDYPEGTEYFPKGYKIGFVLATNAWDRYFSAFKFDFPYYACSTEGIGKVRTAMFKDSKGNIAITFEDYKDDQNFTDVLFALKANPKITNVPTVDPESNTTIKKTGVYSFEDYWPKAYDYDMNDVVVLYTYEKTFNIYNEILKESFTLEPHTADWQAMLNNGLAFTLKDLGSYQNITDSIKTSNDTKFKLTNFVHENNVVILTEKVKDNSKTQYKVTIEYKKGQKTSETSIDAFIFRPSNNGTRLEIHIPMQAPTAKADMTYFNTEDDRSDPAKGIYYVSDKDKIYPFAFFLQGANLSDVEKLLTKENEGIAISELYPKFIGWAKNNNTNKDWYKK